jgi:biotin transport system substrate-specific component
VTTDATTLRYAAFPRAGVLTDVLLVVLGAGLIAAAAQVSIPLGFTPVPVTGQTFAVLLVGSALGTARGGASGSLYLLVGLLGAPIYADGQGGWDVVAGASGGYLIAFPLAAALSGWLAERRWDRRFNSAVSAMLTGNVLIYAIGLPWLALELNTGLERTLELGFYPFVIGDVIKLYLAAALLPTAWSLIGDRRGSSEPRDSSER